MVIVDELDRCRPTYAVGMLETIKHVFQIEGILFVLTVNRAQLDRSAGVLYGSSSDPDESYFSRFFDVEVSLPDGDRETAVRNMLRWTYLDQTNDAAETLVAFLVKSPHGIRAVGQMLKHYSVVARSLVAIQPEVWQWALSTAMLLRLVIPEKYREWIGGEVADSDLADSLFALVWAAPLRETKEGRYLEGALIAASEEGEPLGIRPSKLKERYPAASAPGSTRHSSEADSLVFEPARFAMVFRSGGGTAAGLGFHTVAKRIEMLR